MGTNTKLPLKNNQFLSYFKIEETSKNLNQVGQPRDLNPGPPECESRVLHGDISLGIQSVWKFLLQTSRA